MVVAFILTGTRILDPTNPNYILRIVGLKKAETYVDPTSFNQNPSTWDAELQSLLAMEFQGRSTSYPTQLFTGFTEASNLKMEI
uniref:Uncharacterized protein n=1 Tax=Kalanchoe fedtschenkoi TaxID=63787 RepID=A0A7N0VMA6_KALFE